MATEARGCFLRAAVCLFVAASALAAEKAGETPGDRRHALRYTEGDETVEIVQVKDTEWVARADRSKGRFRTFLLTMLTRFLANEWDKASRSAVLTGGRVIERHSIHSGVAVGSYSGKPAAMYGLSRQGVRWRIIGRSKE